MTKAVAWTIAVALAIAAIASLWLAGEMHYRNCLAQAEARAAATSAYADVFGVEGGTPGHGCSRLPF